MKYLGEPWTNEQAYDGLVTGIVRWREHGVGPWMVDLVADTKIKYGVGLIAFRDVAADGTAEFGWMINHRYWRQGLAFEASTAALHWYFQRFDAAVIAKAHPANVASIRLLNKRHFSIVDSNESALVARLSRSDWDVRRSGGSW